MELYTFGAGADADAAVSLRQIAEETGGEYFAVGDLIGSLNAVEYADQATSPIVEVNIKTGAASLESGFTFTVPIQVDSTLEEMEFELVARGLELDTAYSGPPPSDTLTYPNLEESCYSWYVGREYEIVCFFDISDPVTGT